MFDIRINIYGITELKEKLSKIEKMLYEEHLEIMEDAVKYARAFAPEDTGRLENDIRLEQISESQIDLIADPVDKKGRHYAAANEYGSYSTPLGEGTSTSGKSIIRPFARPAIELAFRDFEPKLDKRLKEEGLQ